MAWGQRKQGIDDLVQRLAANEAALTSLVLMRQRTLDGAKDVARLCAALASNTSLTDLTMASHALDAACAEHLGALLASPSCRLASVCLGDSTFGDAAMQALSRGVARSTCLTALDAEHKGLGPAAAEALGRALRSCPSLTSLNLSRNGLGDAGVAALCGGSQAEGEVAQDGDAATAEAQLPREWRALQHLDLNEVGLGPEGLAALAACPGAQRLVTLACSRNPGLGPSGGAEAHLQRLVAGARRLRRLQLDGAGLGDAGGRGVAAALAQAEEQQQGGGEEAGRPALALAELSLAGTGLTDDGGVALAHALVRAAGTSTCRLASLSLEGNRALGDATVAALCSPRATDSGAAAGGGSGALALERLDLSGTAITPASLPLLGGPALPRLRHLALLGCAALGAGDAAGLLAALRGTAAFGSLRELVLVGCGLGEGALHALLEVLGGEGGVLPELESLEVGGNPGCQAEGFHERVEALRARRPGLAVHWRVADNAQG